MADDTNSVQDTTDTTQKSDVQPGTTLLTEPIQGDEGGDTKPAEGAGSAEPGSDKGEPSATEKADGEKPEGEETDDEKPAGAPEKYEFTAPEGIQLDAEAVSKFEPIARELNLTQEQADKLVGLQAELVRKQSDAWRTTTEGWAAEVKADKEIGNDALPANMQAAQKVLSKFGTPELKTMLNTTGIGNHPELVRVFARIGKSMAEDTFEPAGKPSGNAGKSAAEILYGSKS